MTPPKDVCRAANQTEFINYWHHQGIIDGSKLSRKGPAAYGLSIRNLKGAHTSNPRSFYRPPVCANHSKRLAEAYESGFHQSKACYNDAWSPSVGKYAQEAFSKCEDQVRKSQAEAAPFKTRVCEAVILKLKSNDPKTEERLTCNKETGNLEPAEGWRRLTTLEMRQQTLMSNVTGKDSSYPPHTHSTIEEGFIYFTMFLHGIREFE